MQFNVSQELTSVTAAQFRADIVAEATFEAAVRVSTQLPDALISITNLTDVNRTVDFPNRRLKLSTQAVYQQVLVVDYVLQFFAAQVSRTANATQAYVEIVYRLNDSIVTGKFSNLMRQEAQETQSTSLINAGAALNRIDISPTFSFGLIHSAHPSSQPSSGPTSQPSVQPTSVPSSAPTYSYATKWTNRLGVMLAQRYDLSDREQRAVYFEVISGNSSLFGAPGSWERFVESNIRLPLKYKSVAAMEMVMVLADDMPAVSCRCSEPNALQQLSVGLIGALAINISVQCDGNTWKLWFCSATSTVPDFCINCADPCLDSCQTEQPDHTYQLNVAIPAHYRKCPFGTGNIKMLALDFTQNAVGGDGVLISFSCLWAAAILLCIWHGYSNTSQIVPSSLLAMGKRKVGSWKLRRFFDPEKALASSPAVDDVMSRIDGIFSSCNPGLLTITAVVNKLLSRHRDLKALLDKSSAYYALYTISHCTFAAFITAVFVNLQSPSDRGQCAEQTTELACASVQAAVLDRRQLCSWIGTGAADSAGPGEYQANCIFKDEGLQAGEALCIACIVLVLVEAIKIFLIEPAITVFAASAAASTVIGSYEFDSKLSFKNKVRPSPIKPMEQRVPAAEESHRFTLQMHGAQSPRISYVAHDDPEQVLSALESVNVGDLDQEDHFRYQLQVRAPTPTPTAKGMSKSKFSFSEYDRESASEPVDMRLVPRPAVQVCQQAFEGLVAALMEHSQSLEEADKQSFQAAWSMTDHGFDDKVIRRTVLWQMQQLAFSAYQSSIDFLFEFTQTVDHAVEAQRLLIGKHPQTLADRLLVLFAADLMGLLSYEAVIFQCYHSDRLNPRAVAWAWKMAVFVVFLACNAVFLYLCWDAVRLLPSDRLQRWYCTLFIAIILDALVIENLTNTWTAIVVPWLCLPMTSIVQREMEDAVQHTKFAHSMPIGSPRASMQWAAGQSLFSPLPATAMNRTMSKLFDASSYVFISKQLAKVFPQLAEAQVILNYRLLLPHRILAGRTWQSNLDRITPRAFWSTATVYRLHAYLRTQCKHDAVQCLLMFAAVLPCEVQRMLLVGVQIALIYLFFGHLLQSAVQWTGFWWFALSAVVMVLAVLLSEGLYAQSIGYKQAVDALWGMCCKASAVRPDNPPLVIEHADYHHQHIAQTPPPLLNLPPSPGSVESKGDDEEVRVFSGPSPPSRSPDAMTQMRQLLTAGDGSQTPGKRAKAVAEALYAHTAAHAPALLRELQQQGNHEELLKMYDISSESDDSSGSNP